MCAGGQYENTDYLSDSQHYQSITVIDVVIFNSLGSKEGNKHKQQIVNNRYAYKIGVVKRAYIRFIDNDEIKSIKNDGKYC